MVISVSVVVPVYSGETYLERLINQLEIVRSDWIDRKSALSLAEVILVDDSAVDGSPAEVDRLALESAWVSSIHLSRNYGQHAAIIAGILHTSGDWVVTMDEDLQHPPAKIEALLKEVARTEADVIYAHPVGGVHEALARDATSRVYKRIVSKLTGNKNVPLFNSFRLIRGPIARAASSVCGHETYFDMALAWFTDRVGSVPMTLKDDRYIATRKSGYRFWTLLSHARKMVMSSQVKLMRAWAVFGFVVVATSFVVALSFILQKLASPQAIPVGWTSLAIFILFFGGLVIFLLGVVIEYLSKLSIGAQGKPVFFVVDRRSDAVLKAFFENAGP